MEDKLINGRYVIKNKIGSGSFGDVYVAIDIKTQEKVAFKVELSTSLAPKLINESNIYTIFDGAINFPKFYWFGSQSKVHNNIKFNNNSSIRENTFMAFELLGKSLKTLFLENNRRLSLKTVLMLADQMLTTIQYVHTRHFIHRDLKPDNFVIGLDDHSNQIYLIDFGLSRKYRDPQTLKHDPCYFNQRMSGTPRYASINVLKGLDPSRRDGYTGIWIYLLKGSLPWSNLPKVKDPNHKYDNVLHVKKHCSIEKICEGLPNEFLRYFQEVKRLRFDEEPKYAEYRKMFRDLFDSLGYIYDYQYDWVVNPSSEQKRVNPDSSEDQTQAIKKAVLHKFGQPSLSNARETLKAQRELNGDRCLKIPISETQPSFSKPLKGSKLNDLNRSRTSKGNFQYRFRPPSAKINRNDQFSLYQNRIRVQTSTKSLMPTSSRIQLTELKSNRTTKKT